MNVKEKAAYLAGILDGEGSISMMRRSGKKNENNVCWRIVIKVTNCDRGLIEWLHKNWGGRMRFDTDKRSSFKLNWRSIHTWTANANIARCVIDATLPFLIIKKERAIWARDVLRMQKGHEGKNYTEKIRAKLLELRRRFQDDSSMPSIIKF